MAFKPTTAPLSLNYNLKLLQAVAVAPRRAAVSDYMRRFCSQLDIKRRDVNACTEVADNAVPREGTTRYKLY